MYGSNPSGSKSKKLDERRKDVLPPMKYDENGQPIFSSDIQSEKNIKNPQKSFLARHEQWRAERMQAREERMNAPVVTQKVFTSLLISEETCDTFKDDVSGCFTVKSSEEQDEEYSMDGFKTILLRIDMLTGDVQGEGVHYLIGNFIVEGKMASIGFKITHTLHLKFFWENGKFHPLEAEFSGADDWLWLNAVTKNREKIHLQLISPQVEKEMIHELQELSEWGKQRRQHLSPNQVETSSKQVNLPTIQQNNNSGEKANNTKNNKNSVSSSTGVTASSSSSVSLNSTEQFLGREKGYNSNQHQTEYEYGLSNDSLDMSVDEDDITEEDNDSGSAANSHSKRGDKIKEALPKGPMNYLQEHKYKLRTAGWGKREKDPWVSDPKPSWTCSACSTSGNEAASRCVTCRRDEEGYDEKGYDIRGYNAKGFDRDGHEMSMRQRLALRSKSSQSVGRPGSKKSSSRASTADLMMRETAILRSCPTCFYVGSSPRCPFCSGETWKATKSERLTNLAERIVGNAAAAPGDSKLGSHVPSILVGMTRSVKKGGYVREKVAGMLTGIGNYRNNGCRTWLIVFGGRDGKRRVLNTTEVLTPGATSWRNGGYMKTGRAQAAATHYGSNRVYAIGGIDYFGVRLDSVEYFDVQSNEWRETVSLQIPRSGAVAVELCGKLIVVGGRSTREMGVVSSVECLNPTDAASVFTYLPPISAPRDRAMGTVVLLKGIYPLKPSEANSRKNTDVLVVCGGVNSGGQVSNVVDVYNPQTNTWRCGAKMPEGRFGAACSSHNGLVYIMGGLNANGMADPRVMLVYDVFEDKWITQTSGAKLGVPIKTAVDHVPNELLLEDDTYYGARDGSSAVLFEANRIALVGGVGENSEFYGTVDVLTPFTAIQKPEPGRFHYGSGDAQLALPNTFSLKPRESLALSFKASSTQRETSILKHGTMQSSRSSKREDSDEDDDDDEGLWPTSPLSADNASVISMDNKKTHMSPVSKPRQTKDEENSTTALSAPITIDESSTSVHGIGEGAEDASWAKNRLYLPLWFNGLPALRTRRAWHGLVGLERFQPEVAKLAKEAGVKLWEDPQNM